MASRVSPSQDCDPYADRRVHPRVPVALPAFVQVNGERHSSHLLDLSAGGAKLNCPVRFPIGTTVTLDCGALGRDAVIRWQNGAIMGVCFKMALDEREVSLLTARSESLAARMKTRD